MPEQKELQDHEYLGDGVYVSHDGYQLWLATGSHENPPLLALEPPVFRALLAYAIRIGMYPKYPQ